MGIAGQEKREAGMAAIAEAEHTVGVDVGENDITFSTGLLAKQADGAVLVRSGETVVLATAVGRTEAREGTDFFPLTVDIEEKMYAAGKIPGGFFKREGRATEKATLNARMVDRPIRPLFPKGFRNEVQVIGTVLSADRVAAHDILAINGASAALMLSPLPFFGPGRRRARRPHRGRARASTRRMPDMDDSEPRPDRLRHRRTRSRWSRPAPSRSPRTSCSRRWSWRTRRSALCAAQLELQAQGRQAEVVRPGRRGRARAALRLALRRGDRRARPRRRRRWPRPTILADRAARPSPPTPARTSWCAATQVRTGLRLHRRRAPRRGRQGRRRRSSSATPSARCPTPSRTPRSSSRPSARR